MKHSVIFLFVLISANIFSQTAADEKQIKTVVQAMEDSFNAHDYSFTGRFDILSPNAWFINPVGMYWKNRSEITQALPVIGKMRLRYESVKYTIKNLQLLAPAVALVVVHAEGKVEEDYKFPDGSIGGLKGDKTNAMLSFTLIKLNNNWKIASVHITGIDPAAAHLNPVSTSN